MGDHPDRDGHPTLRRRQRQQQLQQLCPEPRIPRRLDRDAGVAHAEQHLRLLEGQLRLEHHPGRVVPVDDDPELAGTELRLRIRETKAGANGDTDHVFSFVLFETPLILMCM
ncbi:uncharacterized protein PV07_07626 [Cladophialophora immunda]|uniref:Uncharacterized protein n=1 Tax=Cladophialophora immunda TaxID=569365 RepID=A0A0D2CC30_9EURO|nr:uncharacterized protein PV07_07626 [Cladophialophora immunda]KIW27930.1 hypothetical protein PV07_07626 [Cladophialophora immunda]